jgi:hypothetical protein
MEQPWSSVWHTRMGSQVGPGGGGGGPGARLVGVGGTWRRKALLDLLGSLLLGCVRPHSLTP